MWNTDCEARSWQSLIARNPIAGEDDTTFARLVSAQVRKGKLDQVTKIWKEEDIPLMHSVKGYRGAYLLTDRKGGRAISITLWDSERDSVADKESQLHQKQVGMYRDLLTGEIGYQGYEVSARDKV